MGCERLAISRWGFGDFSAFVRKHARWQLCWLWLLGACQLQSSIHSSTELVIDIEIERAVREQSDRISISAVQAASAERALRGIPVFAEDFLLADAGDDRVQRVVLQPRGLATPFVSIHVSAEGAQRNVPVAEARLNTRYGRGEWRIAKLRLGAACIDVSCEASATCADGACVSATAAWADLPLYWPSSDAGRTLESDAAVPLDASSMPLDGSPAAPPTIVDDSGIVTGLGQALSDDDGGASNPCEQAHGGCDERVSCMNEAGAAVCGACPKGFVDVHHDGTQCAECAPCAAHASCQDHRCACERGYHVDGAGCAPDDRCQRDADCIAAASCEAGSDGRRSCQCRAGYTGDGASCEDVDECASGTLHCGAGALCVNRPGDASCQCSLGYVMSMDGSCVDIDECASGASDCDTSPAACVNTPGGFLCQCPSGWSGTGKGPDGCTGGNPCTLNNGGCDLRRDCLNTSPGPTCGDCAPGYRKDGATGCVEGSGAGGDGGGGAGGTGGVGFPWPPWFLIGN
jgi:hypothetical protein